MNEEYDRNKFLAEVASYELWKQQENEIEDFDIYFADTDWDDES